MMIKNPPSSTAFSPDLDKVSKEHYRQELHELHIELVKLQKHIIQQKLKTLIIFEGRDAAGKDGSIKRIVEHLSPRETRVVALGKPSERNLSSWYFQRYVAHLPAAEEIVIFNRSWYNRAGVERVMGFCDEQQLQEFFDTVVTFEQMLVRSGICLIKFYLDIDKNEQAERLEDRRQDPLKQWKISPIDQVALQHWDDYSHARNEMLMRTHHEQSPWFLVRANHKKTARLQIIRTILNLHDYTQASEPYQQINHQVIRPFVSDYCHNGFLAS